MKNKIETISKAIIGFEITNKDTLEQFRIQYLGSKSEIKIESVLQTIYF